MRKKREVTPPLAETKQLDTSAKITAAFAAAPQDPGTRIRRALEVITDTLDWLVKGGQKQAGRPERMRDIKEALRTLRDLGQHTLSLDKPKLPRRKTAARQP